MSKNPYSQIAELFESADLPEILEFISSYCRNNNMYDESNVIDKALNELDAMEQYYEDEG